MQALTVVPSLDPFKDTATRFITCRVVAKKHVFLLERPEEALDDTVVPAIAFSAHAANNPIEMLQGPIVPTGVLGTLIGVGLGQTKHKISTLQTSCLPPYQTGYHSTRLALKFASPF